MSHTIANWDPEDTVAWEAGNKNIARRLLVVGEIWLLDLVIW